MLLYPLKYIVDTCSLTTLQRVYPMDVFPGAWALMDKLIDEGVIGSVDEVLEELKAQDDGLCRWAKEHKQIFLSLDESIQLQASAILTTHPNLIDLKKRKSGADPFVIAAAIVNSAAVVTEEKPSRGPQAVKIPDVCKAYKVPCMTLLDLLRSEGLKLS
jgi:hypothetical protein